MSYAFSTNWRHSKISKFHNPVGRKRIHTLVAMSRARSSRCCGLSSVVYHGLEGKKAATVIGASCLWRASSLTGKVNK